MAKTAELFLVAPLDDSIEITSIRKTQGRKYAHMKRYWFEGN
jgi:hypothetical protein